MSRLVTILAVASTLTLTACSADAPVAPSPSPAAKSKDNRRALQNAKAACMKSKGFKYTPWVPEFKPTAESRKYDQGDYEAMKKKRSKYGLTVFYRYVYTEAESGTGSVIPDPNNEYTIALSEAQSVAYEKASDACHVKAAKQVLHRDIKNVDDLYKQADDMYNARVGRELDGDPQLIDLAQTYGDCLKGKGYRVPSVRPSALDVLLWTQFNDQMMALGREQQPDAEPGAMPMPSLTPAQARPLLDKEVKAALDDLECGKAFFPVFYPRKFALQATVFGEWGQ
ncbi:hypothetical protein [Nonomuraea sp. NPDC046570]|uniref:hypothetical protein n=1 Tax=Nonomuraea sp. NPDC046570 TaxID=3155255 RepID=UPI0033FCF06D